MTLISEDIITGIPRLGAVKLAKCIYQSVGYDRDKFDKAMLDFINRLSSYNPERLDMIFDLQKDKELAGEDND